jgi:hypothetical protein
MRKVTAGLGIGTGILAILAIIFIVPLLVFGLGWVMGWISSIVIGDAIVSGFDAIGIHFAKDQIPVIAGAISWAAWMILPSKTDKLNINKE